MSSTYYVQALDKPLYLMAKPAGAACNLRCSYCYYLEKDHLYQNQRQHMSDELLEVFIRNYIECQPSNEVTFTWHGGEPLLRSLDFYRRAVRLQRQYAGGRTIYNSLQTNGTLLTDDWCRFLHDEQWLVGISLDGPEHCHDHYRHHPAGHGSWAAVMHGVELLIKHGVEFNTMSVINDYNSRYGLETYRFLRSTGSRYMQFSPIVERLGSNRTDGLTLLPPGAEEARLAPWSVSADGLGDFYIRIFDEWVRQDVGRVFVQLFDATLAGLVGVMPPTCIFAPTCGHAAVMEWNGDVYSCDHFVYPEHRLGNILQHTFWQMMTSPAQQQFGQSKHDSLPRQCLECRHLQVCHGECPKNRIDTDRYGQPGLNHLCWGYRRFWDHSHPVFRHMAEAIKKEWKE